MNVRWRVLALLVLIAPALPPATAATPDPTVTFTLAPTTAPADGAPFAVVVEARGPPGATVEVKAWVGTATTVLSYTWDGVAWIHGRRYAARGVLDDDGAYRATLPLSVVHAEGDVGLFARARVDGSRLSDIREERVVLAGDLTTFWSRDGLATARWTGGVALGTAVADRDGVTTPYARVLAPVNATIANATTPPPARLVRADGDHVVVEAGDATPVCLRTRRAVACADVAAGRTRLPVPGPGEVTLAVWGRVVDAVTPPREDALVLEEGGWVARPLGFSAHAPMVVVNATVRPFTYPEDGLAAFAHVAASASRRLDAMVYTLESADAAAHLAAAAARGVTVRLLVEGAPVGGTSPEEVRLLGSLAGSGVEVRRLQTNGSFPARYVNLHAKMLVADDVVLVGSENWHDGALPPYGDGTNRGWGVVARSREVAEHLGRVFEHDWRGADAVPLLAAPSRPPVPTAGLPPFTAPSFDGVHVLPVLAPDDAVTPVVRLLDAANVSVEAQLLFLEPTWRVGANPFVEALLRAAARGVDVRVHLDGQVRENEAVAEALGVRGTGLPFAVRVDGSGRAIHNKGLLVDGRAVLVGSLNWGEASALRNREVALVMEDPRVAAWFQARFEEDWAGEPEEDGPGVLAATPAPSAVAAALTVAALARRRGSRAGAPLASWCGGYKVALVRPFSKRKNTENDMNPVPRRRRLPRRRTQALSPGTGSRGR